MGQAESTEARPEEEGLLRLQWPGDGPRPDDRKPRFAYERGPNDRARLYLYDRVRGASRYEGHHDQPPIPCCNIPPCVYLYSSKIEQNSRCENIGKTGCIKPDDVSLREKLFAIGFTVNSIAFCLLFYASFAIANDSYSILTNASFSKAEIVDETTNTTVGYLYLGLRAVAVHDIQANSEEIISFDEFCYTGMANYVDASECNVCEDASGGYVIGAVMAVITVLPSIFTDVARSLPNYDVNCQKAFGWILGFITLTSTITTMIKYKRDCYQSFYSGSMYMLPNGTVVPSDDYEPPPGVQTVEYSINWSMGSAFMCTMIATMIRFIDVIVHGIVPTPSITRDETEQLEYENKYVGIVSGPDSEQVGEPEPDTNVEATVDDEAIEGTMT